MTTPLTPKFPTEMYDSFRVDGTDLLSIVTCYSTIDGSYVSPQARGDNVVVPGVNGEIWVPKAMQTGVLTLGLIIDAVDQRVFNTKYRDLRKLVVPGKKLKLSRTMTFIDGTETHTAFGEYLSGLEPTLSFMRIGRLTLSLKVLDGIWTGASTDVTLMAPLAGLRTADEAPRSGTIEVKGDTETRRITMTMGAGTVTNTTTGDSITYSGPGVAVINTEQMTAFEDSVNTTKYLSWSSPYVMRLLPGRNTFVSNTGVSLSYLPAYL